MQAECRSGQSNQGHRHPTWGKWGNWGEWVEMGVMGGMVCPEVWGHPALVHSHFLTALGSVAWRPAYYLLGNHLPEASPLCPPPLCHAYSSILLTTHADSLTDKVGTQPTPSRLGTCLSKGRRACKERGSRDFTGRSKWGRVSALRGDKRWLPCCNI